MNSKRSSFGALRTHLLASRSFLVGFFAGLMCSLTLATISLLTLFVFCLSFAYGEEPTNSATATRPTRPIGEMRRDVEAFLKNSKSKDDLDLQVGGVLDLCYMHREIVSDPRFEANRQLKSIRAQAAARLKRYLKNIELEKLRTERKRKANQRQINSDLLNGKPVAPLQLDRKDELENLATASQFANQNQIDSEQADDDALLAEMYRNANSMSNLTGGPSQMFGYLSGNFAPPWDHGEELVELIKSVINPEFWRENGGDGIIYYYRPSRIIIVGATSKVHDDMTNMLRNLRRLSR